MLVLQFRDRTAGQIFKCSLCTIKPFVSLMCQIWDDNPSHGREIFGIVLESGSASASRRIGLRCEAQAHC